MDHSNLPRRSIFATLVRSILFLLLSAITAIALAYALENWRGQRAWAATIKAHAATNDSLDMQAIVPPPIPDLANFWAAPLLKPLFDYHLVKGAAPGESHFVWEDTNAVARFCGIELPPIPKGKGRQTQKLELKDWQTIFRSHPEFKLPPEPSTNPAVDILLGLQHWSKELDELSEASQRPASRAPIHYQNESFSIVPYAGQFSRIASVIQLRAAAQYDVGNLDAAVADIEFAERLARAVGTDPILYLRLMSRALRNAQNPLFRKGILQHRWNESQLIRLQANFESRDLKTGVLQMVRNERNYALAALERLSNGLESPDILIHPPFEDAAGQLLIAVTGRGWIRQNQVTLASYSDWRETVVQKWSTGELATHDLESQYDDPMGHGFNYQENSALDFPALVPGRPVPYYYLATFVANSQMSSLFHLKDVDRSITIARIGAIACALERFRIANAKYPKSLGELNPVFILSVPLDPCINQPFHYQPESGDWFTLYSVGPDGQDNFGTYRDSLGKVLDWPWPGRDDMELGLFQ